MPKLGERVPYRPIPNDFAEVYIRLGVSGSKNHYRAHIRTVLRWIDAQGGDELRRKRLVHLERSGRKSSAHRVMSLTRVKKRKAEAKTPDGTSSRTQFG